MNTLDQRLRTVLRDAASTLETGAVTGAVMELEKRLDGPLRVAIAGRVKAGKSTLLNALVGERLAPTDAGECTRIVTIYEHGDGYDVRGNLPDGTSVDIPFTREDGKLRFEPAEDLVAGIKSITVGWPSARLRSMTLIDTPGLESLHASVSKRTEAALLDGDGAGAADAVVYLLRHVHRSDITFLENFLAEQASVGTPVGSVAVLSRADEVGAARLDALESARAIASRYEADERIRAVVSGVVPVAGLLAETAATLEEREADALRLCAQSDEATLREMLRSADHFRQPDLGPLTLELRELLLARFGLFGVRLAIDSWQTGRWHSGTELARLLVGQSGLPALESALRERFGGRSRHLVSRSVLNGLRSVLEDAPASFASASAGLLRTVEEIEASSHEFAELRMLDLVLSGEASFTEDERKEAERVTRAGDRAARLGLPESATMEDLRTAAISGATRWRERAAPGAGGRASTIAAEILARSYEGLYA